VTSFFAISILGLLLGMRHATDPDHVIAVGTIVSKQQQVRRAAVIGAIWGMGHTLTIFFVGAAIILFRVVVPPRLGLAMETSVGIMLIVLGVLNLTGVMRRLMERMLPGMTVGQIETQRDIGPTTGLGWFHMFRPLLVGIVHGLAGSAAVALLVMATIHDPWAEIGYLLIFGVGTVFGMMLVTTLIAIPAVFAARRVSGWSRGMAVASGLLSVSFGLFISYQTGIANGLLSAHPHWTPR
jgi:high-affinity nickel permease